MEVLLWIFGILGTVLTLAMVWVVVLMTIDYFN